MNAPISQKIYGLYLRRRTAGELAQHSSAEKHVCMLVNNDNLQIIIHKRSAAARRQVKPNWGAQMTSHPGEEEESCMLQDNTGWEGEGAKTCNCTNGVAMSTANSNLHRSVARWILQ